MKTIAQQLRVKEFPFILKDKNNNRIYYENSDGYWSRCEFDSKNNEIYWENSNGYITDNRTKPTPEYTMDELIAKLGYEFKITK